MLDTLRRWAADRGYHVAWGPLDVVDAALADVESRGISKALRSYAAESISDEDAAALAARGFSGIVVVDMPRPAHAVTFDTEGGPLETVLPPTYFHYRGTTEEIRADLAREGLPGARLETLRAPLKQVAARLGLVSYGRNNVTYAPGFGSYHQLAGFLTDARLPLPQGWQPSEPKLLDRCLRCRACVRSCPTGAIQKDRVLLDADRCLTFVNERPGAWPEFVGPSVHHTIIGCLACQRRCPENPKLPVVPSGVAFTREETRALLTDPEPRGAPEWEGVRSKLALLGQPYAEDVFGRNLRALTARPG